MCGITGAAPGIAPELLRAMTATLAHRGPDGEGYFSSAPCSLGHRRLAIIDLNTGAQPMTTPDGRFGLIYNGEVYNFRQLRGELESLGDVFTTQSDTEVLLRACARWGRQALTRLRGMFAFALWDARAQTLLLARDRLGLKPLYYAIVGERLLFGSEIKALLAHPGVSRELNPQAVDDYLTYLYVPAPQTIFRQIHELPPGHWLEWQHGALRAARYWDALPAPSAAAESQLAEELLHTLDEAVRLRMIADVPLGAFLSGGVDSSSIVALMAQASRTPVESFSLGFGQGAEHYSELQYARLVSARYRTRHRELEIHPQCADLLPRMVAHFDEPFGNPTSLLIYELSALTRRHVTVALAGDAGDEVFLGYPRYRGVRLQQALSGVPLPLRRALAWAGGHIPEHTGGLHARRRAREFLSTAAAPWQQAYAEWVSYFTPAMRAALYSQEFRVAVGDYDSGEFLRSWFAPVAGADPLAQVSYVDLHTFLPHNLLEYGDRMSMAHSLEVRLPFTDHHLVEFAMRLPSTMKLRGRTTKYLLREAVRRLLPEPVLTRGKLGLNPPLGIWLRHDLRAMVESYLSPHAVRRRGWFQPAAVQALVNDFRSGRRDFSLHLWALLVLEEWCRQHLDGQPAVQSTHETVGVGA